MGRKFRFADPGSQRGAMIFTPTRIAGAYIVQIERIEDERGFFARSFCRDEFARKGLKSAFVQCNISYNATRGTLRGMHYQASPHGEAKLVRCTRGAIFDVIVDIRRGSATYKQWVPVELDAEHHRMVYVPEGCAHGFQTLADASEVFYQMTEMYQPQSAHGIRYDDPGLGIQWPVLHPIVSARDAAYGDFAF